MSLSKKTWGGERESAAPGRLNQKGEQVAKWKYTKIRMLRNHDGVAKTCVVRRPVHIAGNWVALGAAEYVDGPPVETAAVDPDTEKAVDPKAKKRKVK